MSKTVIVTLADDVTCQDLTDLLVHMSRTAGKGTQPQVDRADRQCSGVRALGDALARAEQAPDTYALTPEDIMRGGDALRTWSSEKAQLSSARLRASGRAAMDWRPSQGEEIRGAG